MADPAAAHAGQLRSLFDAKADGWPGKYTPADRLAGRPTQFANAADDHVTAQAWTLGFRSTGGDL